MKAHFRADQGAAADALDVRELGKRFEAEASAVGSDPRPGALNAERRHGPFQFLEGYFAGSRSAQEVGYLRERETRKQERWASNVIAWCVRMMNKSSCRCSSCYKQAKSNGKFVRTVRVMAKAPSSGMSSEARVTEGLPAPPLRALLAFSAALIFATLIPLRDVTE